ncbi:unnamed protein product [Rotaria socialis]
MITGILAVYISTARKTTPICSFTLKSTARNPNDIDSYPHSVAIADFNNDNWLDFTVANSNTDNVGVFFGFGNETFATQIKYSTGLGSMPYAVAVGDLNSDYQVDIIVANFGTNNIGIFLGTGYGSFTSQLTFSTASSHPRYVTVGNFNNDAHVDIIFANYGTNTIGIFFGYGDGNFTSEITFSTEYDSLPFALAIGDFNKDNNLDVAVANYGTNNVGVFLGYGNGSFASQMTFSTGMNSHPYSIAIGNLNNDTQLDIVVANSGTNNVGVLFGHANGTFEIQTTYFTGNSSSPLSVVLADLNNDLTLDIVVANSGMDNVGVLFGYGNGSFAIQREFATGINSYPLSLAIGDFNKDNRSDIAISNYGTNHADVLFGNNYATFSPQVTYTTGDASGPNSVTIGYLNNDSHLDIIVANGWADNVGVFLGNGDGTFSRQTSYSTGFYSSPYSAVLADVNLDGRLDIVVANLDADNIGILLGYGDGTFANSETYSTGSNSEPCSVAIGDLNNDNKLDIVVANYHANNIGILLGYGDGTFSTQTTYFTGSSSSPNSVAIGDFNNDHYLDIVIALSDYSYIGIVLGHGNGTFSDQVLYSTGSRATSSSVSIGDFNNDNRLDIAATISSYWTNGIGIFLGDGNGSFGIMTLFVTGFGSSPYWTTIGDFNNDNNLDVVVANSGTNNVGIFFGLGDGTFLDQEIYSTGGSSQPYSAAVGDFNNDIRLDITVANFGTFNIGVFLGVDVPTFISVETYSTGSSSLPYSIVVGDFNNDTELDMAVANYGTNSVGVFFGYGNATFSSQTTYSTGSLSFPMSVVVGDFNGDDKLDIAVANSVTDNVGVLFGLGNKNFTSLVTYPTGSSSNPKSIATGDFNNDNRLDIVVANSGMDNVAVILRYDAGFFEGQITYSTGGTSQPLSVATGDFNNDQRLDIVVANSWNYNLGIFLGYGNGTFSDQMTYPTGDGSLPQTVVIGDVNNDGHLDLIITNSLNGNVGIFLGHGDGTFSNQTTYPTGAGSVPVSVAVGDFNNDGRLDIVTANYWTYDISIFLNYGNGTFANRTTYSTGSVSKPNSVVVGDFNNDSKLDIAVTNQGSENIVIFLGYGNGSFFNQSIYSTGDNSQPTTMAIGDFNNDKILDITVANFGTGNIGIFLGYGDGTFSNQMTFATGNNSQPWWVAVGDFNNDSWPDIATANSGTNNIGVLLGCINGTFFNQMAYSTGNSSSPISVAVGDFNNDSRLDIVAANRDRGSIGIFLGYALETFLTAPAYSTGSSSRPVFVASGDFDHDTRLDIAVANNGTDNIMILLGSGFGTFSKQTNYSNGDGSHPYSIAIADFNNDSLLDIAVANYGSNNIGIRLGHGDGTLSNQTTYFTGEGSHPYSVVVCDFNNDTHLDIAVANYGANDVSLFLGYGNGSFASQYIFPGGFESHPSALAVGDMNGDHVIDIIVANSGYDGGGGSQYGMEPFGVSMLKQIIQNKYHQTYSQTHPIVYLFQYRGAGLSKPSIHCYTAKTWIECARELIQATVPSSVNDSLKIIHAMTNQNIAQDLQYQIQYAINQSQSIYPTSTYIYGFSQGTK